MIFMLIPLTISKCSILDKSDDSVSMVRCLPIYLNEETLALDHKTPNVVEIYNEYLFEDCLFGKNILVVPGRLYC